MIRFTVGICVGMLVLTGAAAVWISMSEAPSSDEYLKPDDLRAIGIQPTEWRSQRYFLADGVTKHEYGCSLNGGNTVIQGEVRVGVARDAFVDALALEESNARNPKRPPENIYVVKRDVYAKEHGGEGGAEGFVAVRMYPRPQGGDTTAEVWMQEGRNFFRARVAEVGVRDDRIAERRDWCERQARTIAQVMLGQVRDAQLKK